MSRRPNKEALQARSKKLFRAKYQPIAAPARAGSPSPLSETEKQDFDKCEEILRIGLATFFEVGSALITIRQEKWYRATHATFEKYCQERWGIGRSYACRIIGAAERVKLLASGEHIPKPTN